jgi:hypothetical protein
VTFAFREAIIFTVNHQRQKQQQQQQQQQQQPNY